MKTYKVIATKWYLDTLEETISYIRQKYGNDYSAEKYKKLFKVARHKLKTIAGGLPIIDDDRFRYLKLRKIRVKHYIVVYYVDDKKSTAFLLAIFHSSMDWQNRLDSQLPDHRN